MPSAERTDAPPVDQRRQRVTDEAPLLVADVSGLGFECNPEHLGAETGDADYEKRAQDDGVLGLRLDADAIRTLDVPATDRPHDAAEEDQAGIRSPNADVRAIRRRREGTSAASGSWWSISSTVVTASRHEEPEVDH